MSLLYLYAICPPGACDPEGEGLAGEPSIAVECGGVNAIVGEMVSGPSLTADALRAHDHRVRAIAKGSRAVLPARFGTTVLDQPELIRLVEARSDQLRNALRLVEDREQMTVRVFGRSPTGAIRPDPAWGPGTAWLRARADRLRMPELDSLRQSLDGLVAAERLERARPGSDLVASVFHLIPRGQGEEYRRRVGEWQDAELTANPSGPWPTYAFAAEALS